MKILAIDVGIKNLAYCIINNDHDLIIEDWGILNLDEDRKLCTYKIKKGNLCGKSAQYHFIMDNDNEYLCKKHKQMYKNPTKDVIITESTQKSICCYSNKDGSICTKNAKKCINNDNYCTIHSKTIINKIKKEESLKNIGNQNCNNIPIQDLAIKLITLLDKKKHFLDVSIILIENQPSYKNPRMKTLSTFLYGYFCIRGIIDKKINNSNIEDVKFISPSNKLKINNVQIKKKLNIKNINKSKLYSLTKELSKEYCKAIIKEHNMNDKLKYLESMNKIDDLCDSFLHGFNYLFCQKTIPERYNNILQDVTKKIENDYNKN